MRSSIIGRLLSLADGKSFVGCAAANVVLDRVEACDAFERLPGDRCGAGGGALVEAAAVSGFRDTTTMSIGGSTPTLAAKRRKTSIRRSTACGMRGYSSTAKA